MQVVHDFTIKTKLLDKSSNVKVFYRDAKGEYYDDDMRVDTDRIDKTASWVLFQLIEDERA